MRLLCICNNMLEPQILMAFCKIDPRKIWLIADRAGIVPCSYLRSSKAERSKGLCNQKCPISQAFLKHGVHFYGTRVHTNEGQQ